MEAVGSTSYPPTRGPVERPVYGPDIKELPNEVVMRSRLRFFAKLVQTILLRPITTTVTLAFRTVKLLTWALPKAAIYKVSGYHSKASAYLENEYLKTVKAVRDILFIPSVAKRAFKDMVATREEVPDDIPPISREGYLQVEYTTPFEPFSSYLHGAHHFEVIKPKHITEFAAASDADLNTVMASHIFKPGVMAINFGSPNVATFVTEREKDGSVQTVKVDAKSLKRADMTYHETNGKIQSGVFLIPTNLPDEALDRFKKAAEDMHNAKRSDITCVNTNCRVLEKAGFSIEGVAMDEVVFPGTLMEHLLFRNVIYTDSKGNKHKVYFDILNTTEYKLEEYFEKVDTAVVGTRLRHRRRSADTEEKMKARGVAAKELIAEEKKRLKEAEEALVVDRREDSKRRKVTVSVPSCLGNAAAYYWGRHPVFEVDLSDKQDEIRGVFDKLVSEVGKEETPKLKPFPQEHPSTVTRVKRDLFFSGPMIRFLRRHMMGRVDTLYLHTQDFFKHLESAEGERFNYVLLDDKVVMARVHANGRKDEELPRKVSDWVLSKHALLADRKEIYCSGEMWYDKTTKSFQMNDDSGTYLPTFERVQLVTQLANEIFDAAKYEFSFEAVKKEEDVEIEKGAEIE